MSGLLKTKKQSCVAREVGSFQYNSLCLLHHGVLPQRFSEDDGSKTKIKSSTRLALSFGQTQGLRLPSNHAQGQPLWLPFFRIRSSAIKPLKRAARQSIR
jgi:hypothetical protein